MMKIVEKEVQIVEVAGLESLLGEQVFLMCLNYNYVGKLTGVNDTCVQLTNPRLVYETGDWNAKEWSDVQRLPAKEWYVQRCVIESFAAVDK